MTVEPASGVIDFRLSTEERLLRDSLREMLAAHWSPAKARTVRDDPAAATSLWPRLAEWLGVAQLGAVATCLAAEEAGAALAPGELLAGWTFAGLLVAIEHPDAERAAGAELPGAVALGTPCGGLPRARLALRPAPGGALAVAYADGIALLEADALEPMATTDVSRRFGVIAGNDEPAATDDEPSLRSWGQTAALAAGADALGACRSLLEMTVEYATQRRQFGRQIGTFQAVRHRLVDLALGLERATASTHMAAMLVDAADPRAADAVHAARASTTDLVARLTRAAVQLHGAIAYTWEHDGHVYIRRAYVSDRLFGTGAWHRARLTDALLAPVSAAPRAAALAADGATPTRGER
jgi:alkylation response protein AidB-like acyl-CoA dehydrogenase